MVVPQEEEPRPTRRSTRIRKATEKAKDQAFAMVEPKEKPRIPRTFKDAIEDPVYGPQWREVAADLEEEIYMAPPEGLDTGQKVCRLLKGLYGLKQSARLWNKRLIKVHSDLCG